MELDEHEQGELVQKWLRQNGSSLITGIAMGLALVFAWQWWQGRGVRQRLKIAGGELLLIDESYNANPASVEAALALLAQAKPAPGGRRIAVLGDMLELGQHGPALHSALLRPVDEAMVDALYAAGPLMANLWEKMPVARRGAYADKSDGLREPLIAGLRAGDVVMIKGSLGSRMGPLVDAIKAAYPPAAKES